MRALVWLSVLAWLPATVAADQPSAASVLAASCEGCHHQTLTDPQGMPSLSGLTVEEVAAKLRAYRADTLPGTLMNRIAKGYSDGEIKRLAEYFGVPKR